MHHGPSFPQSAFIKKNRIYQILITLLLGVLSIPAVSAKTPSELWGESGEKWSPQSRLPDFSYAGYHRGEARLPTVPTTCNVRDFGAKGNGEHDDTQAFLEAIHSCEKGAILIPKGRYVITHPLKINKSNIVLRGEGTRQTILYFPTPLNDIVPNWGATTGGRKTSNYSWSGGFIRVEGDFRSESLTDILQPAERGARMVTVEDTEALHVGEEVEVFLQDDDSKSLIRYLYSGDSGDISKTSEGRISQIVRVTRIEGKNVHFDRPLRFEIRKDWKPELRSYDPSVTEVGIEDLCFEFPVQPYEGHFTELGYNPAAFVEVADCWIRNVRVLNCDSGFFILSNFSTFTGFEFETERAPDERGRTGHHGFYLHGSDNLLTDFHINQQFIHDVSVGHRAVGNVISRGYGTDLTLDHHKHVPYENLFTDIDAGAGSRVWLCGGGANLGKHCAARGTFWNIRASQAIPQPPEVFGPPSMNFVGVQSDQPSNTGSEEIWWEAIDPQKLAPANLHQAQLEQRLKHQPANPTHSHD